MPAESKKLRVARPKETQHATFSNESATPGATGVQPPPLKGLARKVLDRNMHRNPSATPPQKQRNFQAENHSEKLRCNLGITETDLQSRRNVSGKPNWNDLPDPSKATQLVNNEVLTAIRQGQPVPVHLGLVNSWVFWARDEQARGKLRSEGCKVPIYTLGELIDLNKIIDKLSDNDLKNIHETKARFVGKVTNSRATNLEEVKHDQSNRNN